MPKSKVRSQDKVMIREFSRRHPCVDQDWIAKLVGVSQSTISRILNRSKK